MKKFLSILSIIGMMILPLAASAQTVDINSLIAQTQALIAQINALKAQQGYASSSVVPTTSTTNTSSNAGALTSGICPTLSRSLSYGASGNDVSSLQQFLAQDVSVYPDQLVTGYFGTLTQAAVQRWQMKYGVVSSGAPDSTGFGVVGPRTKAAILTHCVPGVNAQTGTPNVASGFITVTPATGNVPFTTTITATVNTSNSCVGATYMLDFGDGANTRQYISTAGNCSQQVKTFTHTYTSGGVYTITLSAGGHETTTIVTVNGAGAQTGAVDSLHASVASGTAPFFVTFTGSVKAEDAGTCTSNCTDVINFGDGASVAVPLPVRKEGYQIYTTYIVSHTYTQAGSYIASLVSSSTDPNVSVQTYAFTQITVSGAPVATPTLLITVGSNAVQQGGILPVFWSSTNVATSSAVGLWMVNTLSGALYPLAMTLNTTGSMNAPIPKTADEGTVPPVGVYVALGKIYTPADAVLTGVTPVYTALGRSDTFNVLASTADTNVLPPTESYKILSVATGVGGNQSAVFMNISYPTCSTYKVDWGDGGALQTGGGASAGCGTQTNILLTHTYQYNGTATVRLMNGSGTQQASASLAIANAGTTSKYGMLSVTSGIGGDPLYVSVQLTVPACPSFLLDWGDNTLPASQTASPGCTGTTRQTPTFNHPYAAPGSYIIKLSDASSTLQSSSSIHLSTTTTQ
ncbi:peptidoglycan-binding protein [Candidatus Kaiserbacteria bacterium]|nr:peptidoglycan-binding protein [Candidatus Kaiserbacteria bacterium]